MNPPSMGEELEADLAALLREARQDWEPTRDQCDELYARVAETAALSAAAVGTGLVVANVTGKAGGLFGLLAAKIGALSSTTIVVSAGVVGLATASAMSVAVLAPAPSAPASAAVVAGPAPSAVNHRAASVGSSVGSSRLPVDPVSEGLAAERIAADPAAPVSSDGPSSSPMASSSTTIAPSGRAAMAPSSGGPAGRTSSVGAPAGGAATTSDVVHELAVLVAANEALQGGRPGETIRLLDDLASSTSSPALGEERRGLRVLAECTLGRAGAGQSAERFLRVYPKSPMAARVRAGCGVR